MSEAEVQPDDQERPRLTAALAGVALLVGLWGVAQWPAFVESVYARRLEPAVVGVLSVVTGGVPFSLAEVLSLALAARWLRSAWRLARAIGRGRRPEAAATGVRWLTVAVWLTVWFYGSWGLNYARPDLVTRLGWSEFAASEERGAEGAELTRLSAQMVAATNDAYYQATGTADLGRPTQPPGWRVMDRHLEDGYREVARLLARPHLGGRRGPAKSVAASLLLSHAGVVGFYFPWTAEANINRFTPASELPHAIAHEKAHQRGVASEDEANFLGFLACALSQEPYVRYSGYLFAQRQLLAELALVDPSAAHALVQQRRRGVQRDVEAENAYWRRYEGRATRVQRRLNDAYLTWHGVEGGIASYRRSVQLLVIFARARGGTLLVQ